MPSARLPLMLMVAVTPAAAEPFDQPRAAPARSFAQVTIQRHMIIRIPRLPVGPTPAAAPTAAPLPPLRWIEKKTGKCVAAQSLAAASIAGADQVDLLLNGGKRLRARFDGRCRALDFYSGFYVKMNDDGKVCADRDSIRSRSGAECRIESFRALVPAR